VVDRSSGSGRQVAGHGGCRLVAHNRLPGQGADAAPDATTVSRGLARSLARILARAGRAQGKAAGKAEARWCPAWVCKADACRVSPLFALSDEKPSPAVRRCSRPRRRGRRSWRPARGAAAGRTRCSMAGLWPRASAHTGRLIRSHLFRPTRAHQHVADTNKGVCDQMCHMGWRDSTMVDRYNAVPPGLGRRALKGGDALIVGGSAAAGERSPTPGQPHPSRNAVWARRGQGCGQGCGQGPGGPWWAVGAASAPCPSGSGREERDDNHRRRPPNHCRGRHQERRS